MSQDDCATKMVGGVEYSVRMLPPSVALPYIVKAEKLLMPILGTLAESMQGGDQADVPFGKIAEQITTQLRDEDILGLTRELIKVSEVDGVSMERVYDVHFRGKMGKHHKWQMFAIQTNFSDFFLELKADIEDAMSAMNSQEGSKSQIT